MITSATTKQAINQTHIAFWLTTHAVFAVSMSAMSFVAAATEPEPYGYAKTGWYVASDRACIPLHNFFAGKKTPMDFDQTRLTAVSRNVTLFDNDAGLWVLAQGKGNCQALAGTVNSPMTREDRKYAVKAIEEHQARLKQAEREKNDPERTKPPCSVVKITGVVVGDTPMNLDAVRYSKDVEDLLARHPLRCSPGAFAYRCLGAATVANRTGYIIRWWESAYELAMPLDFHSGRKVAVVYAERSASKCVNSVSPSLSVTENWKNVAETNYQYR